MIKSVCFLTTYKCNARCDYCECRPEVKDRLSLKEMERLIDEATDLGTVSQIVFSGGEPTLLGKDLIEGIRYATSKGMITRVVSNGWWGGKSVDKAVKYIDKLINAGLTEINLSVDDLHQEWIPLSKVKNAFLACQIKKLPVLLAHKQSTESKITREYLSKYLDTDLINYTDDSDYPEGNSTNLISTGTIIPVGTFSKEIPKDELIYSSSWDTNCSSVLKDIIIGANYQLQPCCGIVTKNIPELILGDVRENKLIDLLEEANKDAILNWIALEGPASIMSFVRKMEPSIEFDDSYTGICHACNEVLTRPEVRKVLSENIDKIIPWLELHRSFLESSRNKEEIIKCYL